MDGDQEPLHHLSIHESALPGRAAQGLLEGLRARRLPGRWLYDSPAQAQLWLEYHRAYAPSSADAAMSALYGEAFAKAAAELGAQGLHAVSLGCGGGRKDAALLTAAGGAGADGGPANRYSPLDLSPALVLEAVGLVRERFPGLPVNPLVADLAARPNLADWLADPGPFAQPRLFSCFGMLPNFEPVCLAAYLRGLLGPPDRLLLSANLSPGGMARDGKAILAQYDNPHAMRWYEGALRQLGCVPQDLRLEVSSRTLAGDSEAWRIVVEAEVLRGFTLRLCGAELPFQKGERLELFYSNRFSEGACRALLNCAGLELLQAWRHPAGEEAIFYCRGG
ncbi:MAG: L-histidine N(alpha)-methyltransferase [SAR324 cluster bacterium]|nr:L-histidine N(alpha)-methyltransferase [SAR324 cluster bacterium]